jgi:hypothetical protein
VEQKAYRTVLSNGLLRNVSRSVASLFPYDVAGGRSAIRVTIENMTSFLTDRLKAKPQ